jgi:hypothetical protein
MVLIVQGAPPGAGAGHIRDEVVNKTKLKTMVESLARVVTQRVVEKIRDHKGLLCKRQGRLKREI